MRRHAILFLLALALPTDAVAADWERLSGRQPASGSGAAAEVRADDYAAFELNRGAVRADLDGVGPAVVRIPTPDGTLERFSAVEDPVLARAAQRRFPSIRTYVATGVDDPEATARLDLTALGFHASVQSSEGLWYVDPRFKGDERVHMAYYRSDLVDRRAPLTEPEGPLGELEGGADRPLRRAPGEQVTKRLYRLAIANDPTYAAYFGGSDLLVESAKAVLVNRLNQVYNDDLAIRMEIVGNNYLLNFDTQPEYEAAYNAVPAPPKSCNSDFITRNDVVLDDLIGTDNYDVGHFVGGSDFNGGGVAGLGVVGGTSKGRGCTGLDPPVGDGFAIDYVSHEIGHQFGGPHTFDGSGNSNCSANRTERSSVEPGGGSSIQAYAGICGVEDLQNNSDPYFSQRSIDDILRYVTTSRNPMAGGFRVELIANQSPVVSAPPARTIPIRTPFTLVGTGVDPDGDGLVYMWEQNDDGGVTGLALFDNDKLEGPLFRQFSVAAIEDPSQSPAPGQNFAREIDQVRSFPDPVQVAAGDTNAETGTCPVADVDCFSEFLPIAARVMNFRLTARDRDPSGGGLSVADAVIAVSPTGGPFAVTGPEGPAALSGNAATTVSWDPGATAAAPFDVPSVRVSFSTDGGTTFGYEVLASTDNDGAEVVTVPNVPTSAGRFKVEAVDNHFYDVSDGDLTVTLGDGSTPTPAATETPAPSPAPTVDPIAPGLTPSPSPTPSPTPTASASAVPSPSATATATATPDYFIPTATSTAEVAPTATPPAFPGIAKLGPDLALVRRTLKPDAKGRIKLSLRCKQLTAGTRPARCNGRLKLTVKRGGRQRKAAAKRFSFGSTQVGLVMLRLDKKARKAARRRARSGRLVAQVGRRKAGKRVKVRRPR